MLTLLTLCYHQTLKQQENGIAGPILKTQRENQRNWHHDGTATNNVIQMKLFLQQHSIDDNCVYSTTAIDQDRTEETELCTSKMHIHRGVRCLAEGL